MQEILKIKELKKKVVTLDEYKKVIDNGNNHDFVLYSDNILEGISLLNNLVEIGNEILNFFGVVYEPIDQPIYIFTDVKKHFYSIKICGSFPNWELPDEVHDIESFIDIPDFAIYSLDTKKTIIAGETTETASVGNSQWQREGRKIGSARNKIPFIYQTFYSGKDESQNTIREPTSLQVYNHFLYSIRYKIPSFVIYFDNNFEDANARERTGTKGRNLFVRYIKTMIIFSVDKSFIEEKILVEREIYSHMVSYILEGKTSSKGKVGKDSRILKDFPSINEDLKKCLMENPKRFILELVDYLNDRYKKPELFLEKYRFTDFNFGKMVEWTSYDKYPNINDLISFVSERDKIFSYAKVSKIGIAKTRWVIDYLKQNFPAKKDEIESIFNGYDETVIMPLRIHKKSNGKLTFSPDPESGEIAAFGELFGYDENGRKTRPIVGYCVVKTPSGFKLESKIETKLYKSIANYIDFLIIDGEKVFTKFKSHDGYQDGYLPNDLDKLKSKGLTEEMGVVATFLNLSVIKSDWELCFIHTHHSSWQQLMARVFKGTEVEIKKRKINRVSSKVDLVMQKGNDLFFIAEGKKQFKDFLASDKEIQKIKDGMVNTANYVKELIDKDFRKIHAFICMVDNEDIVGIEETIESDRLSEIVDGDYVVIGVHTDNNKTSFRLFFSDKFGESNRAEIIKLFEEN